MNYSIAASLLMKLDLLEAIAILAEAGFKETELNGRETRLDPNDPSYDVKSVLRALRGKRHESSYLPCAVRPADGPGKRGRFVPQGGP